MEKRKYSKKFFYFLNEDEIMVYDPTPLMNSHYAKLVMKKFSVRKINFNKIIHKTFALKLFNDNNEYTEESIRNGINILIEYSKSHSDKKIHLTKLKRNVNIEKIIKEYTLPNNILLPKEYCLSEEELDIINIKKIISKSVNTVMLSVKDNIIPDDDKKWYYKLGFNDALNKIFESNILRDITNEIYKNMKSFSDLDYLYEVDEFITKKLNYDDIFNELEPVGIEDLKKGENNNKDLIYWLVKQVIFTYRKYMSHKLKYVLEVNNVSVDYKLGISDASIAYMNFLVLHLSQMIIKRITPYINKDLDISDTIIYNINTSNSYEEFMLNIETKYLTEKFKNNDYNIEKTADMIGVSRFILKNKLDKCGIKAKKLTLKNIKQVSMTEKQRKKYFKEKRSIL